MNLYSGDVSEQALGVERNLKQLVEKAELSRQKLARASQLKTILRHRLTEVSGSGGGAGLTFAFSFVREAQKRGDSVLWVSSPLKPFYPSDAHDCGVDLSRLPVVFLSRPEEAFVAVAKLVGSGGIGLLIWDLASWKKKRQKLSLAHLGRINAMARHHRCSVLILTDKEKREPSLGCLVSLRLQVEAQGKHPELLEVEVVRDKRGTVGEGKSWDWRCELPDGLPSPSSIPPPGYMARKTRVAG